MAENKTYSTIGYSGGVKVALPDEYSFEETYDIVESEEKIAENDLILEGDPEIELAWNKYAGQVDEVFDSGRYGYSTRGYTLHVNSFSEIEDNKIDSQVKACLKYLTYSILQKEYIIKPEDNDDSVLLSEFGIYNIESLQGRKIKQILASVFDQGIYYGYCIGEKNFIDDYSEKFGTRRILKSLKPKHPGVYGFKIDPANNVYGIHDLADDDVFPLGKFFTFTYDPEFDNHYGVGDVEYVHALVWLKKQFKKQFALYNGKKAASPSIVKIDNFQDQQTRESAKKYLKVLQRGGGAVVLKDLEEKIFDKSSGSGGGNSFISGIKMLNDEITKGIIAGTLHMNQGDGTGSYSQSKEHGKTSIAFIRYLEELMCDLMNYQILYPQYDYNYDIPKHLYPKFCFVDKKDTKEQLDRSNIVETLVDKKFVHPELEIDANKVREFFGFVKLTDPQDIETVKKKFILEEVNK